MLRCSGTIELAGVITVGGAWDLGPCDTGAKAPPSMAGEVLCFKFANAANIVANEAYGLSLVAKLSGNNVNISIEYYCAVRVRIV